ncbi:TIGR02996 domain-containing protein [Tuwongella immobilis]|uniref:Uncharacterized protein n=1 Tax=Tuwongella immobilis TaxID=692036 RepID=A0A6C2YS16_9BACT|nr:TIGR02996 domain-containing protein [Tuwongella immobilis]VIP04144.1 Uncharacterized protein OS=Sorangium cellulosum (strain So ce56) GN=sce8300 PE=4 SV=1 [Tuwongella immobilis]VTS05653.1 Uncharacterized protein OS=Sorangium cellulosum (strain So ce56) GN=sce8300 PE=4 SV=1 [Tuwongella immobilis]
MTSDDDFLRAIQQNPTDPAPRLIFADWLDERADPRAGYLRTGLQLAQARPGQVADARRAFSQARAKCPATWIAELEQPATLLANPTPYESGWWGVDQGDARPARGTYELYPYRSLPPLPTSLLTQEARFLVAESPRPQTWQPPKPPNFELESDWDRLLRHPGLSALRSCTDCYFTHDAEWQADPNSDTAQSLRFYSDSQGSPDWFLRAEPWGDVTIVCGFVTSDYQDTPDDEDPPMDERDDWDNASGTGLELWYVAPTLEAFLARWWLENEIWYHVNRWPSADEVIPLTTEQSQYLAHYPPPPQSS